MSNDWEFALAILFYVFAFMLGGACIYAWQVLARASFYRRCGCGLGESISKAAKEFP